MAIFVYGGRLCQEYYIQYWRQRYTCFNFKNFPLIILELYTKHSDFWQEKAIHFIWAHVHRKMKADPYQTLTLSTSFLTNLSLFPFPRFVGPNEHCVSWYSGLTLVSQSRRHHTREDIMVTRSPAKLADLFQPKEKPIARKGVRCTSDSASPKEPADNKHAL